MITPKAQQFGWDFQTLNDPHLNLMLQATQRFASAFLLKESPHWLCLLGSSGVGKTHLTKRLCDFWNSWSGYRITSEGLAKPLQIQPARFGDWREVVEKLRSGDYGIRTALKEAQFAALDDIGAERDKADFAKEQLDNILNARLGKWTVVTSNLSLEKIAAQIDPRIASRMKRGGSIVLEITVPDYNLRPKPPTS